MGTSHRVMNSVYIYIYNLTINCLVGITLLTYLDKNNLLMVVDGRHARKKSLVKKMYERGGERIIIYIYIYMCVCVCRRYSSHRVIDQTSITWTQPTDRSTEPARVRPVTEPRVTRVIATEARTASRPRTPPPSLIILQND
jgi:hypothetical protein